jgi:hypothetical protein
LPDGALLLNVAGLVAAANAKADDMLDLHLVGLERHSMCCACRPSADALEKCQQGQRSANAWKWTSVPRRHACWKLTLQGLEAMD